MRVLVLSCNTGGGHNSAAMAIKERVLEQGHEALFMDIMILSGERTSKIVENAYVKTARNTPHLFHLIYQVGMAISSKKYKSPVYYANICLAKTLKKFLDEHKIDVIATSHLFAAETLTYMKHKNILEQKTVAVMTDYTCIPFWEETECDYYIVPHRELIAEVVRRGLPANNQLAYGIPVGLGFSGKRNPRQSRKKLGIAQDVPVFLMIGGSMGSGKMRAYTRLMVKKCTGREQIIIICGNNKKMERKLKKKYASSKNVTILGFSDKIALYMDACDVVFTKPGGLTSTEAAVKGIPIVHMAPIPGCETANRSFFVSHGMSVSDKSIRRQIEDGYRLATDKETGDRMRKAQRENTNKNSSIQIFQLLLELSGEK